MSFLNSCQLTSEDGSQILSAEYSSSNNTVEISVINMGKESQKVTIDCNQYDGLEIGQLGVFISSAVEYDPVIGEYEEDEDIL